MVILNIAPQLILMFISVPVLIYIIAIFVDKKNKPKRDEGNMTRFAATILISRFIKNNPSDIGGWSESKKLCKEMLCDLFYVLNVFYSEEYRFFKKDSFFIKSSERKEKLKKEFSELYEKVIDEDTSLSSDSFYKEYNIPEDDGLRLNLIETHALIKELEKGDDWNSDLSSFWRIIFVSFDNMF